MVPEVVDYRVSRVVVLCKDCGQDVGLYPARHKCGTPSSETPLPPIPKKYLSSGKTSSSSSSTPDSSQNSKLWSKFLKVTTLNNNADYDSDNESEKDGWEGETHISRILREYYENKGADLPGWLYDSDSTTSVLSNNNKRQMIANPNYTNNDNNNISLQPKFYDSRGLATSPTSINYPSLPVDRNRDRNIDGIRYRSVPPLKNMDSGRYNDRIRDRSVPPLKNMDSGRYNDRTRDRSVPPLKNMDSGRYSDRKINDTIPPRGRQPSPNVHVHPGLMSRKSHQQLRTGPGGHIPTNRSKSVSPNPPSFRIPRDIRGNNNLHEGYDRGKQGNFF